MNDSTQWGRVDESNNVYVIDNGVERVIGQYLDGTAEEALRYYVRKYNDLKAQVDLLKQRLDNGASPSDLEIALEKLNDSLLSPSVVGDIKKLRDEIESLRVNIHEYVSQKKKNQEKAILESQKYKEMIVDEIEAMASLNFHNISWKETNIQLDEIFRKWRDAQKNYERIPEAISEELWKRYKKARITIEAAKKDYYVKLDARNKKVKAEKNRLIQLAQDLDINDSKSVDKYRELLEEWKRTGRAGKKIDDALWDKFKIAGDAIFQARAEKIALQNQEFKRNYDYKLSLINEYSWLLKEDDLEKAKNALRELHSKIDSIGMVPRDKKREIDRLIFALEKHVKEIEADIWHKTNPETIARTEAMKKQILESIESLEKDRENAVIINDDKKVSDIDKAILVKKEWLSTLDS